MNKQNFASFLALSVATSLGSIGINPAFAGFDNGSDNGNNTASIASVANSVQSSSTFTVTPAVQAALNNIIASLPASTLAAINTPAGAATLLTVLVPSGLAGANTPAGAATVAAAEKAIAAVQGIIGANGAVNPVQVNNAIAAFNAYVEALVAEVGGTKALKIITNAPGSLRAVLVALSEAGNPQK